MDNVLTIKEQLALEMSGKAITFDDYKNEENLMKFPFCSTSKRKRIDPIEYHSEDGYSLQVTANNTYGMAKIWDFDIVRYGLSKLSEISDATGILLDHLTFSVYECLKTLNRNPKSGENIRWFREALDRLASTTYKTNIFGNESKKRVQGFTIIKYEYLETKNGTDKVKLTFDERLLNSIRKNDSLMKINPQLIRESAGIKKRLLELVAVNIVNEPSWEVALEDLQKLCANSWGKNRFKHEISGYRDLPWKISFLKKLSGVFVRFTNT
jgi:hypothetical protein